MSESHPVHLPQSARVAVFDTPNGAFRLAEYQLRPPMPGEVLVRIRMCTICRSDIHTYQGHRPGPVPGLLGHEIVGDIVALGAGVASDLQGHTLAQGDRITWSEYFVPKRSYLGEVLDLPQKSPSVCKYGHMSADTSPHHHGGFGEYCYIHPDSWILKLPEALSDEEATPINCGVATMCAVIEAAQIQFGQIVVIQGLGLLGLYGAALAKARGAGMVIGIDPVPARQKLAMKFGVDNVFDPGELSRPEALDALKQCLSQKGGGGADVVIEICGNPEAIPLGLSFLRAGGRYLLAGTVNPDSQVNVNANLILRQCITMTGIHNYHPRHLIHALEFILANRNRYPFHELVDGRYPLEEIHSAMRAAATHQVLRAAILPSPSTGS